MKITWYTTASIQLNNKDTKLLIDPYTGIFHQYHYDDYLCTENVLITHNHLDHVGTLKDINPHATIYTTKIGKETLSKELDNPISLIHPYDELRIGSFDIIVYPTKHIQFDRPLIKRTMLNKSFLKQLKTALEIGKQFIKYKENNEIVGYFFKNESVFVLGSAGLLQNVVYPEYMKLLVLPFQGNSHIESIALDIVNRLHPESVLLTHFDDSFPPISNTVDTTEIEDLLNRKGIKVYKLNKGESIEL